MLQAFWYRIDAHTHDHTADHEAVVCVTPRQELGARRYYSVGIHPWEADTATDTDWQRLRAMAVDPRVVAVGECGLDTRHLPAVAMEVQTAVFKRQAALAEELGKPLIIHCVGAYNQLIALRNELRPTVPWIVHGFRGKPQLAADLVRHGFYISLDPRHNPDVPAAIPADRLLHETDAETKIATM